MNSSYMNVYNDLSLPYDRVEFHRLPQTHKRSYDLPSLLLSRMLFLGLLLLRFLLMFVFRRPSRWPLFDISPGCIPCKVYAEDTPILTIDSIVICQTHAVDLRRRLLKMHPGLWLILCIFLTTAIVGCFSGVNDRHSNLCHTFL
jgi:hypothetical protein